MSAPAAALMAHAHREFEALLTAHRGIVLKVAGLYCRHPDDRADLAQDIATQLWRAWPGYDPARPFATWAYRIALNVAISAARDQRRHRDTLEPLDEAVHDVADPRTAEPAHDQPLRRLEAFIRRQPPLERALLMLYLDERPQREIADILGLSETNVSTKIGRLKQRLRDDI